MTDQEQFEQLLAGRNPCVAIFTYEEQYALSVVRDAAIERVRSVWIWSVGTGLRDGLIQGGPALANTDNPAGALARIAKGDMKDIFVMLDLAGHLKDDRTRRMLREAIEAMSSVGSTLVMIESSDDLPPAILAVATRFDLSLPDEKELEQIVRTTLKQINEQRPIQANLTRADLSSIIHNLRGLTRRQTERVIYECVAEDRCFDVKDIGRILAIKRRDLCSGGLLDYVEAPTSMDEIGGLKRLKDWLCRRQDALSDDAVEFGLVAPRGVLMLGVQGAGKSLAAKAVATAWKRPLLRMDVGALYDKYIGESEKRLRDALSQAEAMSPIVLWIDEIEKAFASAASQSSDGGLSKRMFGTLLTWMQEHTAAVFLIATANDIEALPPELLRKGRFDEIFFVDLPTAEARKAIFQIHLKKRKRDPAKFDLDALTKASDGCSGAEIESAVMSALHDAFSSKAEMTTQNLLETLKSSPPLSVTMKESVDSLREWSVGRCMPAE